MSERTITQIQSELTAANAAVDAAKAKARALAAELRDMQGLEAAAAAFAALSPAAREQVIKAQAAK